MTLSCFSDVERNEKKLNYPTDEYEIDLLSKDRIETKGGLIIIFGNEIIGNIQSVAEGLDIIVKVNEFYEVSDFIFNNLQTVTKDNRLLESAGMFKIELFSNGKKLNLADANGLSILFPINGENRSEFKSFEGELSRNNGIVWKNPSNAEEVELQQDTMPIINYSYDEDGVLIDSFIGQSRNFEHIQLNYLKILPKDLNWINIDRFLKMNQNELTKVDIEIEGKFDERVVGIVLKGLNSYISLYSMNDEKNKFESNIQLPKGEEIKIVGFCKKGNDYYLSEKDIIVGDKENVILDLSLIPIEELHPKLKR